MLLINAYPIAPFLSSELWDNLSKLSWGKELDSLKFFGDSKELLRLQYIISPKEVISQLKQGDDKIDMTIFVNVLILLLNFQG